MTDVFFTTDADPRRASEVEREARVEVMRAEIQDILATHIGERATTESRDAIRREVEDILRAGGLYQFNFRVDVTSDENGRVNVNIEHAR